MNVLEHIEDDRKAIAELFRVLKPGGELYYGSDVAAPVFADVMTESLRLLAVPPDNMPARDPGKLMQAMADRDESR